MESVGQAIDKLMSKYLYIVEMPCPSCGGDMYAWRSPGRDGHPRCAPACLSCGHKMPNRSKESTVLSANEQYERSLRQRYRNFFRNGSVLSNKAMLDKTFEGFQLVSKESNDAKTMMQSFVKSVMKGERPHAVLAGAVGVGKTHLSMAALNEILAVSGETKYVLFINYLELTQQIKYSYNDERTYKQIMGGLIPDIKTADVVVLDDIGAELGNFNKKSTKDDKNVAKDYNVSALTELLDARMDKATIFTTNLTGQQIKAFYGDRVFSRMMSNTEGFVKSFVQTQDYRISREATA